MATKTRIAAAVAAAGALVLTGAALAQAATGSAVSGAVQAVTGYGTEGGTDTDGTCRDGGGKGGGAHEHTDVTGAEADKVAAAVTAKDSAVSVESVQKDPDGSYDVQGTKDGAAVFYDVSADLATVTERAGRGQAGGRGQDGGRGQGGRHGGTGDGAPSPSPSATASGSST